MFGIRAEPWLAPAPSSAGRRKTELMAWLAGVNWLARPVPVTTLAAEGARRAKADDARR